MLPIYLISVSFHMCLRLLHGDFILVSYQSLVVACNLISSRVLKETRNIQKRCMIFVYPEQYSFNY